MKRKEWLQTFLNLVDKGRPTIEYRKKLRIKVNELPKYIKNIGKYRKELEALLKKEEEKSNTEPKQTSFKRVPHEDVVERPSYYDVTNTRKTYVRPGTTHDGSRLMESRPPSRESGDDGELSDNENNYS